MSETTTAKKRLRWRAAPREDRRKFVGFDLWYGDHAAARKVAEVRRDPTTGTCYFKAEGGRNSLLADEKYGSMQAASAACRKWVRGEIRAERMW